MCLACVGRADVYRWWARAMRRVTWVSQDDTTVSRVDPEDSISGPKTAGPDSVDASMVGKAIWLVAVNESGHVWRAGRALPGAFWVKGGKRVSDATKDQPLQVDVPPDGFVSIGVLVPQLPKDETPDALRVSVLEDGVCWYTVLDIPFRRIPS